MALELHQLKPASGSKKKRKRVGRGNSSGHGNYSTRGMKGQRSRSGGKSGLRLRGMKNIIQNIPKKKGFKSIHAAKQEVNLKVLEKNFSDNDEISPRILLKKELIDNIKVGVKILGDGSVSKKFNISGCDFSKPAKIAINKAGGSISTKKPKAKVKSKKTKAKK